MTDILYQIIGSVLYLAAAIKLIRLHRVGPSRFTTFFSLSVIIPLWVFYTHYFLSIPFTLINLVASLFLLNAILFAVCRISKPAPIKWKIPKITLNIESLALLAVVIVLNAPYLFYSQPIIGGDSPHYLYNSQILLNSGFPQLIFDRSIVYFLPAIVHLLTGLTVHVSLIGIVAAFEWVFVSIATLIAKRIVPNFLIPLYILTLGSSLAVFNLSKFTIAFFLAATTILFILYRFIYHAGSSLWFTALVWGSLFNLHGVVSFASSLIIGPIAAYQLIHVKRPLLYAITLLAGVILAAQPLIFTQGSRLYAGIVRPALQRLVPQNESIQPISDEDRNAQAWVAEFTRPTPPSFNQFPLYQDSFSSTYSTLVLVLALIGFIIALSRLTKSRFHAWLYVIVVITILTQQEFIGWNWFPLRFIFFAAPLIYILAFYAFDKLAGRLTLGTGLHFSYPLIAGLITLPTILTGIPKHVNAVANILPEEYTIITQVADDIRSGEVVFVAGPVGQWFQSLVPQSKVYLTHTSAICQDETIQKTFGHEIWEVSSAFSQSIELGESVAIFQKYADSQSYIVYLDTKNYRCINGDLFPASRYRLLHRTGDIYLLRFEDNQ